jgi:hypothetical protein
MNSQIGRPAPFALVTHGLAGREGIEGELTDSFAGHAEVGELVGVVHDVLNACSRVSALQKDNFPVAVLADRKHPVGIVRDSVCGQLFQQFFAAWRSAVASSGVPVTAAVTAVL